MNTFERLESIVFSIGFSYIAFCLGRVCNYFSNRLENKSKFFSRVLRILVFPLMLIGLAGMIVWDIEESIRCKRHLKALKELEFVASLPDYDYQFAYEIAKSHYKGTDVTIDHYFSGGKLHYAELLHDTSERLGIR